MKRIPLSKVQSKKAAEIVAAFDDNPVQVLAWYTGSGKTNIFLEVAKRLAAKHPRCRIGISSYLHRNIKVQTAERAEGALAFGVVESVPRLADVRYTNDRIQIFNPQTLFQREPLERKFDYLIIDEAHVGTRERNRSNRGLGYIKTILKNHCKPNTKILAATATAWDLPCTDLFKGAVIHKRGMDEGLLSDGRISDFSIHAEQVPLKLKKSSYTRDGYLKPSVIKSNFEALKYLCVEKVKSITTKHSDKIGNKCLVIVPPGRDCEIARVVASALGKQALFLVSEFGFGSHRYRDKYEDEILAEFRSNSSIKYLVVVQKCQVGFDMPELESTIDLTMTQNIALLVQRWGRLARINGDSSNKKNYFYVFDDSLIPEHAEWIVSTAIDYAMCDWKDGLPSRKLHRRAAKVHGVFGNEGASVSFSDFIKMNKSISSSNYRLVTFSDEVFEKHHWTKERLVEEASRYANRTELSVKNRYVYNQLKKHYSVDLNEVFPIKHQLGKWNEKTVIEALRKSESRDYFSKTYSGARDWIRKNTRNDLLERFLPENKVAKKDWTRKQALELALKHSRASDFRKESWSAHRFLVKNHPKDMDRIFGATLKRKHKDAA